MKKIKSIPVSLRPREKILKYGPEALKSEELFSAILITGNKSFSVTQISDKLMKLVSSKKQINKELLQFLNLGPSKIAQVLALLELGKRLNKTSEIILTSAEQVFAHCHETIKTEKESLVCFYINGRGELLKKEIIATGILNRVNLCQKKFFRKLKNYLLRQLFLPITTLPEI